MGYTEMIPANIILHGSKSCLNPKFEHNREFDYIRSCVGDFKSVLQLGGSNPQKLYDTVKIIMKLTHRGICNYSALNLNCGCPSPKVSGSGKFGASLMKNPEAVKEIVECINESCNGK